MTFMRRTDPERYTPRTLVAFYAVCSLIGVAMDAGLLALWRMI